MMKCECGKELMEFDVMGMCSECLNKFVESIDKEIEDNEKNNK